MNVLPMDRKIALVNGLCNGMSLRACSRVFNTHRTAIQNLLVRVGRNCDRLVAENMKGLDLRSLEMDELWTFCLKKERMLTKAEKQCGDMGDQYLFFAINRETKVIPAWALGKRTGATALSGDPDPNLVCTSIVERSNLTVRTMQRRFTRLALGFSKKLENLKAAVALNFAYYNFCWIPRTLRVTPAMTAGATDHLWDVSDLVVGC